MWRFHRRRSSRTLWHLLCCSLISSLDASLHAIDHNSWWDFSVWFPYYSVQPAFPFMYRLSNRTSVTIGWCWSIDWHLFWWQAFHLCTKFCSALQPMPPPSACCSFFHSCRHHCCCNWSQRFSSAWVFQSSYCSLSPTLAHSKMISLYLDFVPCLEYDNGSRGSRKDKQTWAPWTYFWSVLSIEKAQTTNSKSYFVAYHSE